MSDGTSADRGSVIPDIPYIRRRDGTEQRATFFELFFDLVYVFAVTQLSHHLLAAELSWAGAAETAFMLVAVYWAWNQQSTFLHLGRRPMTFGESRVCNSSTPPAST